MLKNVIKLGNKSIFEFGIYSSKTTVIISKISNYSNQNLSLEKKMNSTSLPFHQQPKCQYLEMFRNGRYYKTHSKKPDPENSPQASNKPFYLFLSGTILTSWFLSEGKQDFLHQHFYNGDGGWLPARGLRSMVLEYGMALDKRKHEYKFRIEIGKITDDINADTLSSYLNERIYRTVPFALMGGDGKFGGKRVHGATATAAIVGDVITSNFNQGYKMINQTKKRHLLDDGRVTITLEEENRVLYLHLVGTGTGNFAYFNEKYGYLLFYKLMEINKKNYIKTRG